MKARNQIAVILFAMTFISCKWQYKTVEVEGEEYGDYYPMDIPISDTLLNRMGYEGWELVASYPIVTTTYADMGREGLVIHLKSNARTIAVRYIFKKRGFDE